MLGDSLLLNENSRYIYYDRSGHVWQIDAYQTDQISRYACDYYNSTPVSECYILKWALYTFGASNYVVYPAHPNPNVVEMSLMKEEPDLKQWSSGNLKDE